MKVVLAEDDETSAEYVRKGLTENGYTVDWVTDGREAPDRNRSSTWRNWTTRTRLFTGLVAFGVTIGTVILAFCLRPSQCGMF